MLPSKRWLATVIAVLLCAVMMAPVQALAHDASDTPTAAATSEGAAAATQDDPEIDAPGAEDPTVDEPAEDSEADNGTDNGNDNGADNGEAEGGAGADEGNPDGSDDPGYLDDQGDPDGGDNDDNGDSDTPDVDAPRAFEVDAAVLEWGISNVVSTADHEVGLPQFLSAGVMNRPQQRLQEWAGGAKKLGWQAQSGNVMVQKWNPRTNRYEIATWDGFLTSPDGRAIGSAGVPPYSGHQFRFTGGEGSVDLEANTAQISWSGSVTVVMYGGRVLFHLTDPELTVAEDGAAYLTADIGGVGSTVEKPDEWKPIHAGRKIVAELQGVTLGPRGFSHDPRFAGVNFEDEDGFTYTHSFPHEFVETMHDFGLGPFWAVNVKKGREKQAEADLALKKPLPVTVSYDAAQPEETRGRDSGKARAPLEAPSPLAPPPPATQPSSPPTSPRAPLPTVPTSQTDSAPAMSAPVASLPPGTTQLDDFSVEQLQVDQQLNGEVAMLVAAPIQASPSTRMPITGWQVGGTLLLLAAVIALGGWSYPVAGRGASPLR